MPNPPSQQPNNPTRTSDAQGTGRASAATTIVSQFATDPDMCDLVRMFVEEMPGRVQTLQEYWSHQEFNELRRAAHQIKGASGGYGFPQVGHAAAQLENTLTDLLQKHGEIDLERIQQEVNALIGMCNRVSVR